ncbi:MAG: hypothetical protein H0U54_12360 [Acidobacteria bacterium]|nr:hypothetical protein [Acidobacteriota bacterium]
MQGLFAEKRDHQNTWLRQLKWTLIFLLVYPASNAAAQYQFDLWNTDQGLPQNAVQAILQTRDGYLWLTTSDGLVRFDGVRFTVFNKGNTKGLLSNRLTALYEGRDGSLRIGTEDRGLIRYRERGFTTYTTEEGLKSNWIWAITEDAAGHMLVLTRLGVMIWNEERFIPYRSEDGLSKRIYNWPDRLGGLSFFDDQVLHVFDGRAFRTYNEDLRFKVKKPTDILKDQHGTLWFVAKDARLIRLKDGVFSSYAINGLPPEAIITALFQEQQGAIWIGTARHGLGRLQDGTLTIYSEVKDSVRAIYEDREGTLWIGAGDGLRRVRRQDITVYAEKDGLLGRSVNSIFEDREGSIWLGTWRGGLNRLKDGKFTRYTTNDGLFNNGVFQILEDERGYFWMSCNLGIYRIKRQELEDFAAGKISVITSIAYGKKDGMLSAECNGGHQPAGVRTRDGRLWFPTQDGAAVIDPQTIEIKAQPPPVVVEDCLLDNKPVNLRGQVEIAPGQQNIEIRYRA